jgi:CzcA family heavy metal efflux pump
VLAATVRWCLRRPLLVAVAALALLLYGSIVLSRAKFDVFPDFVPAQSQVQTEAPGLSAEQVEALVTRPVEQAISGAQGVVAVRSDSVPGLSIVDVVFAEGSNPYRARQAVVEALSEVSGLPGGVKAPKVQPLTSSTMDLLKVGFTSSRLSPLELRDLVQWTVRPRLMSVPGMARATVYGGQLRRIEVRVRPDDLASRGLGFSDVTAAVRQATGVSGGGFIDTPQQRVLVEPRGQALTAAEVAEGQILKRDGAPVRIGDVADVLDAAAPDVGDALIMGQPGVLLSMSSQYGANTQETTKAVEGALAELTPALQRMGVTVHPGLHRPANFIDTALKGIGEDLLIGAALIALVLFLFMRDPRTVLVSFVSIPLSLLAAVIVLSAMGWTINTMTLGGLAVALGVVVDDAVIDVENIVRRLRAARGGETPPAEVVLAAALEVRAPVIYATFVLALVLLPVLLLHGLQGSFFRPLAAAFIIAILASLLVAILVTPPLALLLLSRARLPQEPGLLTRAKSWHQAVLARICEIPVLALGASAAALVIAVAAFFLFNNELLPQFREGHFVLQVSGPPGTSLEVMRGYGRNISRELLATPGIATVEQQIGRSEGGEDPWSTERSEFHLELKPNLSAREQDRIQAHIHEILDGYPGMQTEVLTFLGDRIGESLTGETAALAISIFGEDLEVLDRTAGQIEAVLKDVPDAEDVQIQVPPTAPTVRADLDFPRLAQHGLSAADVLDSVQTAYEGSAAAQVFRDNRAIDIAVTAPPGLRQDPEAVGELLLRAPDGSAVPLKDVARVYLADSRTNISHEGGLRRQVVTANPAPAKAARFTRAARQAIASKVKLPPGVYLAYAGTAAGTAAAQRELAFNVLIAAAGVIALLLIAFGGGREAALILGAAPFALLGGVIAVALTGASLSLGSLVGFVTLFGVAARNAILLVAHTRHLVTQEAHDWSLATVLQATRERVTPILMTALVTALGLLPLALQTGQAGREIQGPMAIVILGGLASSTVMSLLLLPALIWRFWRPPRTASSG